MRALVIVGVLLVGSLAHADAKADVEALVNANLEAIAKNNQKAFNATLRKDAYQFLPSTDAPSLVERFHGYHTYDAKHTIEKITVVADTATKTAWFHVQFTATYNVAMMNPDGPIPRQSDTLRMAGIALDDGGWKIAAVMYGHAILDKTLYERTDPDAKAPAKPTLKGDKASAGVVAKWFAKGGAIAGDQSAGTIAVNGTAAGEYGTGSVATTMVKAWDKLKLWPIAAMGKRWGAFPIAMVKAEVGLPVKAGGATKMRLAAILVKDGETWRWASLAFFAWFDESN